MNQEFDYDVFLSHSSHDKPAVRALAERLRADGLRVWLDEWVIRPGDVIGLKIEEGLERSRALLLFMSPHAFASDWVALERHTLLFRDPANKQRRFLPLLLADCQPPAILAQFAHLDWREPDDVTYKELLRICSTSEELGTHSPVKQATTVKNERDKEKEYRFALVLRGHSGSVDAVAIAPSGNIAVSGSWDASLKVWNLKTGRFERLLGQHSDGIAAVTFTPDGSKVIAGSKDKKIKVWEVGSGGLLMTLAGHQGEVKSVAVTPDGNQIISGSRDDTLKVWDLRSGQCIKTLLGHDSSVQAVAVTSDNSKLVSGSSDNTLKVWDLDKGDCLKTLSGHSSSVLSVAITDDGKKVVSGSGDYSLRVWDLDKGDCLAQIEGHFAPVSAVAIAPQGDKIISCSWDGTVKLWELESGRCVATCKGHESLVFALAITPDGKRIISGGGDYTLRLWDLPEFNGSLQLGSPKQYTNAKVALIGESGVGKSGLAIRLVEDRWEKTDSTHGMNVWQLPLAGLDTARIEREVWLWDFAGQPDYRLIHQLYMDETALAVMVIDPQKENPLEPLAHWEKALGVAVKNAPAKLLVAGRCDRGGVTISQAKLEQYCKERGYDFFLHTSAKAGEGCADLKEAIARHIPWDKLPYTSTTKLFKTLKDAILRVKQDDIALIRFAELRQRLQMELQQEFIEEAALRAVVGLLGGQGLIKPLDFGDFILLRPEEINNYASVVVRQAREHSEDIGCVPERDALNANLPFPADMKRLKPADEEILLRAMVETFVNRSLCIREDTPRGAQLVFPSYFKQERDEITDHPNIFVTYGFAGVLDEIYATLVVRLHYTNDFQKDQLWKYAADFTTHDKRRVGLQMRKKNEGEAEITVYFEAGVGINTQVSFIKYIHEHLLKKAKDVTRVRSYVCTHCNEPLENRKAIKARLERGDKDIACGFCEKRVVLVDMIEEKFASDEFRRKVQELDEQAQINLDNESLELILVGHAFTIAGEAGQIFRPTPNSDWGIDGEIEFKNYQGQASGERLYLQLKSGDSYLRPRKRDEKEVFYIKEPRWAEYWQAHKYPVMLVIRNSDGRIRWMNVTEYLRKHGPDTKQIVFDGELFTALNVSHMRDKVLPPPG